MDDYDMEHISKYKSIINFYCGDLKRNNKNQSVIDKINTIDTIKKTLVIDDEDFYNRVILTICKLKNGLNILDSREITCIGARVHQCNPSYDGRFGSRIDWYLVQVWRGSEM